VHCGVGWFVVKKGSVLGCPPLCISHAGIKLLESMVSVVVLVLGLHVGTVWLCPPIVLGSKVLVGCLVISVLVCPP